MATKTSKAKQTMIEKLAYKGLGLATKANDFALKTTETAFMKSFAMSEKCIGFTGKMVKRGFEISSSQQDLVFDVLESAKKKVIKK